MKKLITLFICVLIQVSFANSQYWKEIETIPSPFNSNYWLDVYFHPSNSNYGWVCGFNGMVIRTTDGGNTWAGAYVAGAYHLEHVHFPSLTTGYTSGPDGIFKSTNGGQTWAEVTPDIDWDYWGCYFVNDNVGLVVGGGCVGNQRFYKTTNGGQSWTLFSGSESSSGMTDLIIYDPNGLGYAASSGKLWKTTDGGNSWTVFASSGSNVWNEEITNVNSSFLLPYAGTTCPGGGGDGGMRFTTNMGNTWNNHQTGVSMFGTFLLDDVKGWACGNSKSVYYTSDAGVTWKNKNCGIRGNDSLDDIWFINDKLGFTVGDGVYRLSPAEYKLSKDSLVFDNLCSGENKTDSLTIENLSFDNTDAEFQIVDDAGNHFLLIAPNRFKSLNPCDLTKIIIGFYPKDDNSHSARLQIVLHPGTADEETRYVELIGTVTKSTAFPQDTLLILNSVVCNTNRTIDVAWFVESGIETIIAAENLNKSTSITTNSGLPFTIKAPVTNFSFIIQLPDTGWHEARFKFTTMPCRKDTFITVRAYGVSPIISHRAKAQLNSECLTSVFDTIRIFNTGNAVLDIGQIKISPAVSEFSIIRWLGTNPPVKIQPKEFADLIIEYKPLKPGVHIGVLSIENNDSTKINGNKNPYLINLRGVSETVILNDSLFIDFGTICLNLQEVKSVWLSNIGNIKARLAMKSIPKDFSITFSDVNNEIGSNDSVKITVIFKANNKGIFKEVIEISSNPCDKKTYLTMTANVVSNELEIIPDRISGLVKTGETLSKSVRINSLSDININIKSMRIEPPPVDWTYSFTPNLPMVLLPLQGADFIFKFSPTAANKLIGKIVVETDGLCPKTYYIDLDLSSFNRFVEVSPSLINFGLDLCTVKNRTMEVVISNKGFDPDTVSQINLSPASTDFIIDNLPNLPLIIQPEGNHTLVIRFNPSAEGLYSTKLNIKTIDPDGQSFEIPLSGEFRKSVISPRFHELDFGSMEKCSEQKFITVEFENNGTIADTLNLITDDGKGIFEISRQQIELPAGSKDSVIITIFPENFTTLGEITGKFIYESKVCPDNFTINTKVNAVKSSIIVNPVRVNFGEKWTEESKTQKVTISNSGDVDVTINQVNLSDEINFSMLDIPIGKVLIPSEQTTFDVKFIGTVEGLHTAEILVHYSSDCNDSTGIALEGSVTAERYENLIYIDRYEAGVGDEIDISVNLGERIDRIKPDRIDFEIQFDKYLFYPSSIKSLYLGSFSDVTYSYNNGIIKGFIENQFAENLLANKGEIIRIRGLVLASLPDSTKLIINNFDVKTDKSLTILKKDGLLKLTDYCEGTFELSKMKFMPWFKINAQSITHNGLFKFDLSSTSDVEIKISIIDISGIVYDAGNLISHKEITSRELNLQHLSSGTYFMVLESNYQTAMIRIINLK